VEFEEEAIVLGARPHGEAHAVAELFTAQRGRWAGLVYGGQSRKTLPVLQPGNGVKAVWKGRLDDSLGHFTLELSSPRAARHLIDRFALSGLSAAASVTLATLTEREPHPRLFAALNIFFDALDAPEIWPALLARYELGLLAELGFGLSLDRCVATGGADRLIYVSPRSGAAVSETAGEPYKNKLLPLPAFLRDVSVAASPEDIKAALVMTGYFIETRILHPAGKELPEARKRIVDLLQRPEASRADASGDRAGEA
jgi:DNA repair protein RecO (recombination protein O)